MKPEKSSYAINEVRTGLVTNGTDSYRYRAGAVYTPYGIVDAYTEPNDRGGLTALSFIHAGRLHRWTWNTHYSDRYIGTLARRMAHVVVLESSRNDERFIPSPQV